MDKDWNIMNKIGNFENESVYFRKACESDVTALREVARKSEAVWGFDNTFLQVFDETYNITKDFVRDNMVYVMEQNNVLIGFWGIIKNQQRAELEFFYINASQIRMGYGRLLWNHMLEWCCANHVARIDFVTSQPAVGFYMKCGARLNGTTCSMIDGREIPKLCYEFQFPV